MFDKLNASTVPSKNELISVVKAESNALLIDLCRHIEAEFDAKEQIDYSACSMAPGWNLKYKKSSKSICTIYPYKDYFTVLITLNFDALELFNIMADTFCQYIRDLAANTSGMNGAKWLSVNVTDKIIAEDVKKLLKLKAGTKKS